LANRKTPGEKAFDIWNYGFLTLVMLLTVYPFIHVVLSSISDPVKLLLHSGVMLYPQGLSHLGYKYVFDNPMITRSYLNTIQYVLVGSAINMVMTTIFAYALSRRGIFIRKTVMLLVIFTMFFSGGLIPSYLLVLNLGFINKIWALVIPGAINTWNLIILRTAFENVPEGLSESAKIDGANDFAILFRIMIPLVLPVLLVILLFYSVGHWNSWFSALIFLRSREKFPLQLILREILISMDTENMLTTVTGPNRGAISELVKNATIIVATLPIICVYPFLQKYFIKGVMIGAMKE